MTQVSIRIIIESRDTGVSRKEITPVSNEQGISYGMQRIRVAEGDSYRIVQLINGQEILLDDLIAQHQAADLNLIYGNGVEIQLEGFYSEEGVSVFLPGKEDEIF
ncbi:MAG: hypothetical protein ABGX32_05080, partial [Methylococcales bacterium]